MAVLGGKTQEGEQGSKSVPLLLSVRNPQIGYPSFCCDDVNHPEALIYEPSPKRLKLVGVEFITDAARGLRTTNNQSPVLEGSGFSARRHPERVYHPQTVLRIPRLGVLGQSTWRIRGLERSRDLRTQ